MRLCEVLWYNTNIFTNQEVKMSKSRFSGGTLGNGRWDEEEHPRGKDGRFASGGGGEDYKQNQAVQEQLAKAEGYWKKYVKGEIISDALDNRLDEVETALRKQGFTLVQGDNGYFAMRMRRKGAR